MKAGPAGLATTGTSIGLTILVALLGPSAMEPPLPGRPGQPPYSLVSHPPAGLAVALAAAALVAGTLGLGLCLHAARRGWAPSPRALATAGIAAAVVLVFLPPFGSADHLSYAAYGRMLVTGHDPYATGPAVLGHDPISRAVEDWRTTPSVYGPLATAGQALASLIGRTSVRLTVFVLSLLNLAAFAGAGLLLHRLARGDRGRQLRAALLWTANPLLLYELLAGAHVDTQAAVFALAAVAVFPAMSPNGSAGWQGFARCVAAGALTGLGAAVKLTAALAGGGLAWAARRRWQWVAGLATGFVVAAGVALASGGPHVLRQVVAGGSLVSIGSPWRAVRVVLRAAFGYGTAGTLVSAGSVIMALVLLTLLLRGLPGPRNAAEADLVRTGGPAGTQVAARAALAVTLAWLFAWPYVLPWYDALAWALLPLIAWSWLDWLVLARTAALAFGYLPARGLSARLPADLGWLQSVARTGVTPAILTALTIVLVVNCLANTRGRSLEFHDPRELPALSAERSPGS
jgi:Glycosyltransferase family 87